MSEFEPHVVKADCVLSAVLKAHDGEDAIEQFRDAASEDYLDVEIGDMTMQLRIDEIAVEKDE
ncbi:hypothetical protein [Halorhabdus rudnickae]|uniref:hypothetical protein n=1 Tax=Halorhabdus rudnickae TaxID=1775544 RepID=UPI001082FCD4|nr:hypothetical protein [Halorhabdus rudnickae]